MAKRKEDLRWVQIELTFERRPNDRHWHARAEMCDRSGAFPIYGLASGTGTGASQAVAGQGAVRAALDNYRRG